MELKAKQEQIEKKKSMDFTIQGLNILYKTALHACRLVTSDQAFFLFPNLYRQFMQYTLNYDTFSLNSKVHQLINYQKRQKDDQSIIAFDVDWFVNTVRSVAHALWEHVCILTQSVNEHRGCSATISITRLVITLLIRNIYKRSVKNPCLKQN